MISMPDSGEGNQPPLHSQSKPIQPFDLMHAPLTGVCLIEASAGTGKTYTIGGLYLRLILEKGLSADQILVVTFTKAATAELKDRIRNKLIQARDALKTGNLDDGDSDVQDLVRGLADPVPALEKIRTALMDFDRAAIMTIHGFCLRVLSENAFETGALFDTELSEDQSALLQEVAEDFWRIHFYNAPLEWVAYAAAKLGGPSGFQNLIRKAATPGLRVIPEPVESELTHLEAFRDCFNELRNLWPSSRADVAALLADPGLSGTVYGAVKSGAALSGASKRDLKIRSMLEEMDRYLSPHSIGFPVTGIENFSRSKMERSVRKGCDAPAHPLFDRVAQLYSLAELLEAEMAQRMIYLKSRLISFAGKQLEIRKKSRNTQFFDDLLVRVYRALQGPRAGALTRAIQEQYRAALVDEFQDTDPIQYEIFSRLFGANGALYLIGDPKQAIYGFRGADIFAYMKAAKEARQKCTLTTNWRSSPAVIAGINAVFSKNKTPFVFDEIGFYPAQPAPDKAADARDGLVLWLAGLGQEKLLSKDDAVEMISFQAAQEISNLLSDPGAPFQARDIAVLVRTNRQARIVKQRLDAMRIPAVLYQAGSIFDAPEAGEVERVLRAVSEPRNERRLRSALATHLIGAHGSVLDRQAPDPAEWERRRSDFAAWFEIWNQSGFIQMFRRLMAEAKVKERLLSYPDGERRMTNVLHLAELLHQASAERRLGMRGLVKWLARQRDPSSFRQAEAHQLRLESDREAVSIVTIHKSKGLEYPVVFCPFCWDGSEVRDSEILFHDPDKNRVMDIGTGDAASRLMAREELLSENLRLLYVALTRAKKRCYAVWGRIQGAETSALAYLLHTDDADLETDRIEALKTRLKSMSEDQWMADLEKKVLESGGAIRLVQLPVAVGKSQEISTGEQPPSEYLRFTRKMEAPWKIASYSSWVMDRVHSKESSEDRPDRDPVLPDSTAQADVAGDLGRTIFSFPRGTRAGLFFHEIFEHLDFADKLDAQEPLIIQKLSEYGFEPDWKDSVCEMIRKVLAAPLKPDLRLASVSLKDRINEMEFYYPVLPVRPGQLAKIFAAHGSPHIPDDFSERLGRLEFSPARGLVKGFVDLVFRSQEKYYLVDWKSNFLGNRVQDYDAGALAGEMSRSMYVLQYHLYVLALTGFLEQRMENFRYERDFGGVFYIFLRGVDPEKGPDYGVFHDIPSSELIQDLKKVLIAESKHGFKPNQKN